MTSWKTIGGCALALVLAAGLLACGDEGANSPARKDEGAAKSAAQASFASRFLVAEAPGEPIAAADVREFGVDGADVVTTGRIDEFVDGFAVFTIVDLAVPWCEDGFE